MNIFFREILPFINIVYQPENSLLIIIITIFGFIYKPEFYRKSKNNYNNIMHQFIEISTEVRNESYAQYLRASIIVYTCIKTKKTWFVYHNFKTF